MNDNGKVSINAYDVTIESKGLVDDTNKGHAVIIRNKNANVSVTATNDVKISAISGKDAIRIDGSEGQVAGSSVNISAGNIIDINGQIYNRQGSLVDIDGKNITPHKLRATYGTQLYNKTGDIYFVQECMGHSNPKVTELYVRDKKENTKRAGDIMDKLL